MSIYNEDGTRAGPPRQHFLDVGTNLKRVVNRILKNDNLIKLLYYNVPDAEAQSNLTNGQKVALINDYIKLVPKLPMDMEQKNYLVVQMDQFSGLGDDMNFRSFTLSFDVICHADNWIMDDYMLRPFKILHELDSMFNNAKIDSLGPSNFLIAQQIVLNEDFMGYSIHFRIVNLQ
jgi:hypothetical protein